MRFWAHDRWGFPLPDGHRFPLAKEGLRAHDALVLDRAEGLGVPLCTTLAGGYATDIRDTVEINLATARAVAARGSTGRIAAEGP